MEKCYQYLIFGLHFIYTEELSGKEPCEIYKETLGECGDGFQCVVENDRPICK